MTTENIGATIKYLRKLNNMSQKDLAEIIGKSVRMVQKYESNEVVPSIALYNKIKSELSTSCNNQSSNDVLKSIYDAFIDDETQHYFHNNVPIFSTFAEKDILLSILLKKINHVKSDLKPDQLESFYKEVLHYAEFIFDKIKYD